MNADWRTRYDMAIEAARKAGQHALSYFDRGVSVEWKTDRSPVTVADRESETILRETLLGAFPNDSFLGEEFGNQPGTSGYRWIIDPVDGTRSFVRNIPLWATLVALEYKGEPIAGVAYMPALGGVTYRGLRGDGVYRDERRIRVSDVSTLAESFLFYSSVSWFVKAGMSDRFLKLAAQTQRQRGYGDFYGFVLLAQGSGEIMAEHGVHVWDVAGLQVLVEEAGGKFTNWKGERDIHSPDVIASNGKLHDVALAILQGK
ncbi:MAG TPA: inositol monophosphatase family protein [Gemmataceae bacterium]|nr:inositol monophosphatase family protein [Gemmataceae bacterium]